MRRPAEQEPNVYMAGCPSTSVDSGGATPDAPVRGRMARSPRQSGCVGDGDAVVDAVRLPDALGVPVGV